MLNPDFKELLQSFHSTGVDYLLVGGYAMAGHGYPRYTGDIDLWIWSKPANAVKIIRVLEKFGLGSLGLDESDFTAPQQVIQLGYPPSRIDLLTDIDGVEFEPCWERRVMITMDGVDIPTISLDDLIRNKKASGRLQDLADIDKLTSKPR